jgi:apolipoprotein N-acyltransferase
VRAPRDYHEDLTLRLVQAAIPQADKWVGALRDSHLQKYLTLSKLPAGRRIDVLIWPESATPFLLERDRERYRKIISNLAPGQLLITGTPRLSSGRDGGRRLHNGAVMVDWQGRRLAAYDKVHLVPFGEFLPFRSFLARFGLDKLAVGAIDYTAGEDATLIAAGGLPSFRLLICYEILFARELAATERPDWLLNLTNDAWFGLGAGPVQHLQISRARAVEQGLPLVRAANTGISAIIDAYGRTDSLLGVGQSGVIDGPLPANRPLTLFARFGDIFFWGTVTIFLIFASLSKVSHIYGSRQGGSQ